MAEMRAPTSIAPIVCSMSAMAHGDSTKARIGDREGSRRGEMGGRWKRKDKQGGHSLLAWETRTGMEEQGAGVEIDLTTDVCENPS